MKRCNALLAMIVLVLWAVSESIAGDNKPDTIKLGTPLILAIANEEGGINAINEKNEVFKINELGQIIGQYKANDLGNVHQILNGQALRIILLYKDQQTIVVLDRNLREFGRFNAGLANIGEMGAIAVADAPNFWVWDNSASNLKKITLNGQLLFESRSLQGYGIRTAQSLITTKNYLVLISGERKIAFFDQLGNLAGVIDMPKHCIGVLPCGQNGLKGYFTSEPDEYDLMCEGIRLYIHHEMIQTANEMPIFINTCEEGGLTVFRKGFLENRN